MKLNFEVTKEVMHHVKDASKDGISNFRLVRIAKDFSVSATHNNSQVWNRHGVSVLKYFERTESQIATLYGGDVYLVSEAVGQSSGRLMTYFSRVNSDGIHSDYWQCTYDDFNQVEILEGNLENHLTEED